MYHKLSSDQKQQKTQLFFAKLHSELHSVIQNYQNSSTNQVKLVSLMTHLKKLHNIKRKFKIKNMQFKKNKNKKLSRSYSNKNLQQDHKHKHNDTSTEQNFKKRHSFISWKNQEKKCEKNLYFAYDKSNHQARNCYFKKKMTSDKLLILELMWLDINKLMSDFHQIRIYTDLEIKISSRS